MVVVRREARALLLLVLVLLLAACTSDPPPRSPEPPAATPSPTAAAVPITGPRVAILLPASGLPVGELAAYAQAVERLRSAYAERLGSVQRVTLDDPTFASDTVTLLAEEGYDLVCVVGATLAPAVPAVARAYPRTRFCGVPATYEDPPGNVLAIDLAVDEPAFVLGAVAATLFPRTPPGFVGTRTEYAIERRRQGFQEGWASRREQVPSLGGIPAEDPASAVMIASRQLEAGARLIYTAAGEYDAAVRELAAEEGVVVAGSAATLLPAEDDPPPSVLLAVRTDVGPALAVAVDRLLDAWDPTAVTVGHADGAFSFVPGGHALSGAAVELAEEVAAERFPPAPTGDPTP